MYRPTDKLLIKKLRQSDLIYSIHRSPCLHNCPASWASQPMGCLLFVYYVLLLCWFLILFR